MARFPNIVPGHGNERTYVKKPVMGRYGTHLNVVSSLRWLLSFPLKGILFSRKETVRISLNCDCVYSKHVVRVCSSHTYSSVDATEQFKIRSPRTQYNLQIPRYLYHLKCDGIAGRAVCCTEDKIAIVVKRYSFSD